MTYAKTIAETIGTDDPATVALVEELMRCEIRTLDHLSPEAFRDLAHTSLLDAREMARDDELGNFCAAYGLEVPTVVPAA